jgi:hypothetical protein
MQGYSISGRSGGAEEAGWLMHFMLAFLFILWREGGLPPLSGAYVSLSEVVGAATNNKWQGRSQGGVYLMAVAASRSHREIFKKCDTFFVYGLVK